MEAMIGRIEPRFDILRIYFSGCDFSCPNCNEPQMLRPSEDHATDTRDIKKEMRHYSGKAVEFTGGEPCLQRQALLQLAGIAKDLDIRTRLETNGTKTECIRSLLRMDAIDEIILDLKSPFTEEDFQRCTRSRTFFKSSAEIMKDIKATIRLLKNSKPDIFVRTVITPTLLSRKEQLHNIADAIEDLDCIWLLAPFSPQNVEHKMYSSLRQPSAQFLDNLAQTLRNRNPALRVTVQKAPF